MNPSEHTLIGFTVLAFSSLFVIVDPLSTVPAFVAMTPNDTPAQRVRISRLACTIAAGVLMVFTLAGQWIFRFLGITMPAFELAASVVMLLVALDMLRARRSPVQQTHEEAQAGAEKADIAITPLAIPLLAGPGAISTCIVLQSKAGANWLKYGAVFLSVAAVCFVSHIIFRLSAHGAQWLNPIAMRIANRIMGLLLAAIAFQFGLNALKEIGLLPAAG